MSVREDAVWLRHTGGADDVQGLLQSVIADARHDCEAQVCL
jgi:hypothetical protein